MKQTLKFNLLEQAMVIESLEACQVDIKEAESRRVDQIIAIVDGGCDQYDSEEMIYMVRALEAFSKVLTLCKEELEAVKFSKLAERVDRARKRHQDAHHPLKRYKKAKCAATQTA